ncbi:N-acetyltransferase [Streptacidiphilus pinicola]|uniref:N-acetyltransferase n=1 Tax=Streptacidiphilus pinicola TaxID=2219663 RepID=A0A2X0JAC6_9ACTN|nr:GNAT family N-acetyltransferase [Streptacidiphilus pinicola]RAG87186.1 N-acetyltransferase [Streptacidiphilus pinicola]
MLDTPRLTLRRFRAEDAPALAAYRSDPEVAHFKSWTAPVSAETARAWVRDFAAASPAEPGLFPYAIELTAERRLIGDIGVRLHENLRQAELGFTLARDAQGHGYATEALRAVLADLFDTRGLHRVSAECDARNLRSAALLERVGFVLEGRPRQATWLKGEWTDDLVFGLLVTDPR